MKNQNSQNTGNQNQQPQNQLLQQRKAPTRDDLSKAIEAARQAAEAAVAVTETVQEVLAGGGAIEGFDQPPSTPTGQPSFRQRGTRDWPGGQRDGGIAAARGQQSGQSDQGGGQGGQGGQGQRPTGPGAEATGHGMAQGGGQRLAPGQQEAWQDFMDELQPALQQAGERLEVSENSSFVKIESLANGHKLYINKGKTTVTRIECTLDPSEVRGAAQPDRKNGRIKSWIPASIEAVSEALQIMASDQEEQIAAPQRGGGDTQVDRERGQGQQSRGNGGGNSGGGQRNQR